ncbi:heme ABC transporter ATP-binding protein [Hydrogenophaga sp.]|uniref:heme ABC transporter ATP-binding protein n=1 Tax=Hydrogenophaga sp. TaxID=1904254 RepID=UPI0019C4AC01|nr:heme ABC transporter ATP-binding protein [Hydrogenophaga sp.]MBD3892697.1 heme ABC transporter ATP-binding protein [Hydrogenophaga sp.]
MRTTDLWTTRASKPGLQAASRARAWAPSASGPDCLQAQGVSVHAAGASLLQAVDLHLDAGEVGVLLGPNGAGKSTLLSVLAGLQAPHAGAVWLNQQPVSAAQLHRLARQRAVLPQECAVAFDFRVQDVVELGRYPHRQQPASHEAAIVQSAMQLVGVASLARRSLASLSGGERARVQLARVLAQIWQPSADGRARWLLLDEPTAALDLRHQHEVLLTVRRWAREQGVGVLAVLHDLNLALRYADQVWVLDGGSLVASGPPAHVLCPALLQRVWQVQASPVHAADGVLQLLIAGGDDTLPAAFDQ